MKIKKSGKFFKSLRFRILIILIILGIVPSVIVTEMVIANYEDRAIANRVQSMENICDIMCDLLIKENYLNDSSSQTVNSKLELLSNIYGGRILIVDRDFRIIKDTYGVDEGKTLVSQKVVNCFKGEDAYRYDSDSQKLILAVPVKSPEVNQVQGAMMIMASSSEVTSTIRELEQKGILIIGIIVVLAIFLGYILSTVLVKPFARVTKAIEDLTDGYQNEEISVPDYTETALITDAFNKMLSRMKTLERSRKSWMRCVFGVLWKARPLQKSAPLSRCCGSCPLSPRCPPVLCWRRRGTRNGPLPQMRRCWCRASPTLCWCTRIIWNCWTTRPTAARPRATFCAPTAPS